MESPAHQKYEVFLLVLLTGFIGVFIFTVRSIWNPFLILLAVILLSLPLRQYPVVRGVIGIILFIFSVWFFSTLSSVLAPAMIAVLLAYILDPLIDLLVKRRVPRLAAVTLVMVSFLVMLVGALFLVIPAAIDSFRDFNPHSIGEDVTAWFNNVAIPTMVSFGLREADIQQFLSHNVLPHVESILGSIVGSVSGLALGMTALLGQLANAVIIPILMFYILLDWDRIKEWIKSLFPPARRETARKYYRKIDAILAAYLRGAITIALINTIVVSTLFSIVGIPFAILLGILSGMLTLIPQFGVFISIFLSILVCLFGPSPGIHIIFVLVILLAENLLESSVLYPKIVGDVLGLHPAALIVSLVIFAYFLGFLGMLIAVPTTSLLARLLEEWMERRGTMTAS